MKKKIYWIVLALLILAGLYSACDGGVTKAEPTPTPIAFKATATATPIPNLDPADIPLFAVESSALSRVGYSSANRVLVAEFKDSGAIYAYYDVPQSVYNSLISAESIGNYFYYNVRTSYDYERIN